MVGLSGRAGAGARVALQAVQLRLQLTNLDVQLLALLQRQRNLGQDRFLSQQTHRRRRRVSGCSGRHRVAAPLLEGKRKEKRKKYSTAKQCGGDPNANAEQQARTTRQPLRLSTRLLAPATVTVDSGCLLRHDRCMPSCSRKAIYDRQRGQKVSKDLEN